MHTGFVFSADVVAEETRKFICNKNLTMDLSNMGISRRWLLRSRVEDVIVKHVENDLRIEMKDDSIAIQQPVSSLKFELFKGNLDGYTEDQITFNNITPLVHAMFKGNWGIEVEVVSRHDAPNLWRIDYVGFVKQDPNA